MKTCIRIIALAAALIAGAACEMVIKKAPDAVARRFGEMYPGAAQVEWEKEGGTYTAEFLYEKHEMEAEFAEDGTWQRSKADILLTEVPDPVYNAILELSENRWEVDDIEHFTCADGDPEYYRITFDRDFSAHERVAHIAPDGSVLKIYNTLD